jgi:acetyl esterase/lipase
MIDKQIRLKGMLLTFFKFNNIKKFKMAQWFIDKFMKGKTIKNINCKEIFIKKRDDNPLRVCIYKSLTQKEDAVGLLWIHGGGYAIGVPEMDLPYAKLFIEAANCVVISPDYTLSIKKPYPAALEDCYETLYWIKKNAKELGIKSNQIFIGGDSAGGGLTAATTLYARDKGEVNIAFQMPLYPMIDDKMNTRSAKDNNAPVWNSVSNATAWKIYLGNLFGTEKVPKYAAPIRETNYSNLPPAWTFVGSIEPFFDETVAYFNHLREFGVTANISVYDGCYHGFDQFNAKAYVTRKARNELIDNFKYAVNNYFAEQP